MTQFQLWDLPINSYSQKIDNLDAEAEKLKKELREAYPEFFSGGLGRCTKMLAKFELQNDIKPVLKKKRNVPFASLEQINEELDRLVRTGVLLKVEYSEWATPTVYVKKKSKEIHVCTDFSTGLNAALKDCHYHLPCPEDIFAKLNGWKIFSERDLSNAYLQISVEEESSKLLCLRTHHGLYKFETLPFRVKVSDWWAIKTNSSRVGNLSSRGKNIRKSKKKKKALGIIFAVSKFHRYIYGRHFIQQTDHKLLLTILGSKRSYAYSQ